MRGMFKFHWGPVVGALIGAALMAALASGQENGPIHTATAGQPALHGVVNAAWNAVGQLVVESVHKLAAK